MNIDKFIKKTCRKKIKMLIDNDGIYTLEGNNETDHNTIFIEMENHPTVIFNKVKRTVMNNQR